MRASEKGYGDQFLDHAVAGHVFRPQSVAWMSMEMDDCWGYEGIRGRLDQTSIKYDNE